VAIRYTPIVSGTLIGYARCSTDTQDLTAQRDRLRELGVAGDRIYLDHELTGTSRKRPGLDQALAAVREGDTLVVPKLDRLARSVPDARGIGDDLAARGIRLSLGGQVYDPADPMGKMFFNILATFAEFEATCCGCVPRRAWPSRGKGQTPRPPAQALGQAAGRTAAHARLRRLLHRRSGRTVHRVPAHRVPDPPAQPRQGFRDFPEEVRSPKSRAGRRACPRGHLANTRSRLPRRCGWRSRAPAQAPADQ
jgi:Resolvase, N terminal domain